MMNALENRIMRKILLASDFPSGTIDNVITGLRNINVPVEGTGLPIAADPAPSGSPARGQLPSITPATLARNSSISSIPSSTLISQS